MIMMRFAQNFLILLAIGWFFAESPAQAQTSEAALKDRVGQLLERLDAPGLGAIWWNQG